MPKPWQNLFGGSRRPEAGDELRHVEERLACDCEHRVAVGCGDQLGLGLRERAAPAVGVERVADAHRKDLRLVERLVRSRDQMCPVS